MNSSSSRRAMRGANACAVFVVVAAPLLVIATAAQANLTISTAPTKNVTFANGVYTATAKNAVLNVSDLQNGLGSSNIKVATGSEPVDIHVAATLSWASANTLTLDSYRSIVVANPITVAGQGGLTLTTNDGGSAGDLSFIRTGNVTFWGLESSLMINGGAYTLVNNVKQLAQDVSKNSTGNFALAASYDASKDGTYAYSPIGEPQGTFEGLGNSISNLTISDTRNGAVDIGLFAALGATGTVRDFGLVNVSVTVGTQSSSVGGIVGMSSGTIRNSYATGMVAGGASSAGLLTGFNAGPSGTGVFNSYAKGTIAGVDIIGGAVGLNYGTIVNTHANVSLSGDTIGGLVGESLGSISNSSATGSVIGTTQAGGLVGNLEGPVSNSHSTGTVTGGQTTDAGGLAGLALGSEITGCYAKGAVSAISGNIGGLIGYNYSETIDQSYATGAVSGQSGYIGGFVGDNGYMISNSYSTGSVTGASGASVGGFAGYNSHAIATSYSRGAVTGNSVAYLGGFVGYDDHNFSSAVITDSYWDLTTSGVKNKSQGAGNVSNDSGITGLTSARLRSGLPSGFLASIWGESANVNRGMPYLLALPPT
jgi:hypothetical protein